MLNKLKDIQKLHSLTKVYLIGITVIAVLVSVSSIWMSYQFAEAQREKIYVLDQGKSLILALEQDIRQSRPAEAKAHVQRFHELFFTLTPNMSSIENNVNKALQLSDETPAFYYKERKSKQYYDHIVQGGIICEIFTDSVIVNMDKYPYEATYYGKTSFMRSSDIEYFSIVTTQLLINAPRTDTNPHGFVLGKWNIREFSSIKKVKR